MDFWNSAWQGPHFYSRRFQSICGERGVGGWVGGGGEGWGGAGKHGIAKIGLTPPHPGTHIYSTLCIQEYLIGSQNNWFGLGYKLPFSLHDMGKTLIKKLRLCPKESISS